MTAPVLPGVGTQPLGTTPLGWPPRDIAVALGDLRRSEVTAGGASRLRIHVGRRVST